MSKTTALVMANRIESSIMLIRGHRVMLDSDLAAAYGTTTKALNQAIKRNAKRFPADFMFQLTQNEKQEVVTNCDRLRTLKFSTVLPYAFTEHGAVMLASVLNSPIAVQASIAVVRAFIRLREVLANHKDLASKLAELERRTDGHSEEIGTIFEAIRQLMEPPEKPAKRIGFQK